MPRSRGRKRSTGRKRRSRPSRSQKSRGRATATPVAPPVTPARPVDVAGFLGGVRRAGWGWPVSVDDVLMRGDPEVTTRDARDTVLVAPESCRSVTTGAQTRWLLERPLLYHAHSGRYLLQRYDATTAQGLLAATLALRQDRFPDRGMATASAHLSVAGWCNFFNDGERDNRGAMRRLQRVYCVGVNQLRIERMGMHDAPRIFPKAPARGTTKVGGREVDLAAYKAVAARAYGVVLALALQQSAREHRAAVVLVPLLHLAGMSPQLDTVMQAACASALTAAVRACARTKGGGTVASASVLDRTRPVRAVKKACFLVLGYPTSTFNMPGNEYFVGAGSVSTEAALAMASTLAMHHNPQANAFLKQRLERGQVVYV